MKKLVFITVGIMPMIASCFQGNSAKDLDSKTTIIGAGASFPALTKGLSLILMFLPVFSSVELYAGIILR